ncbi:MAG: adenylyl-sulfate kinase [Planctomycetes bacterium]|nr:adenylyl-sulfate kinase [Planctomycetota bacterium]
MATTQEDKAFVLWFTGLSGSGKSTLADRVYDELSANGNRIEKLDGDVLRGIFPATGFTKDDRDEHIRRVGFLASMLEKHGVIVVASFISPYKEARNFVRQRCGNFIEVYVSTSLDECRRRDVKGLYKRADAGEIKNFTGIDDPYEEPENAEIVVDTEGLSIDESVAVIINALKDLK